MPWRRLRLVLVLVLVLAKQVLLDSTVILAFMLRVKL